MCITCRTAICAIFDALFLAHFEPAGASDISRRPRYFNADIADTDQSRANILRFGEMIKAADGIGYQPTEFLQLLAERSEYPEQVQGWMDGTIPNGIVRQVILNCAEMLIRERGATPVHSLRLAA